ncbi:hypothetical protein V2154_10660 [Ewingella sp. CoE-038-23]|uniref:hypothetical protein n=1 Tax=Ewingella docleensis TaxID=3118588 RepID=UPI00336597A2
MHNNIVIQVKPEFTGRIMLHINDGQLESHEPMLPGYHLTTLQGFLEMAQAAGYQVKEMQNGNS